MLFRIDSKTNTLGHTLNEGQCSIYIFTTLDMNDETKNGKKFSAGQSIGLIEFW